MTKKIKILFLASCPLDSGRLRLDEEFREIEKRILMATERDRFELISQWAVTPDDLQRALLRHKPHIVHFSGHGSITQGIILEDNSGNTHVVSKSALIGLFKTLKDNIRIIVLNSCYSRRQAIGLSKIIDYTIGVQTPINDSTAILFAASFYQGLAHGRSVKEASNLTNFSLTVEGVANLDQPKLHIRKGVIISQPLWPKLTAESTGHLSPTRSSEPLGQPLPQNITVTVKKEKKEEQEKKNFTLMIMLIIAGLILFSGLYFIFKQHTFKPSPGPESDPKANLRKELYTKTVDQLGNQEGAVRSNSIKTLGELVSDSNSDDLYEPVIGTLTDFIRTHSPLKPNISVQPVISGDVQAALEVLGRRKHKWKDGEKEQLELSSNSTPANLKGAALSPGAHLEGVLLNNANLEQAQFRGVNLQEAVFANAILRRANLAAANLQWANFDSADLEEANLLDAKGLIPSQLCVAKSYRNAKLPSYLIEALKKTPCRR